MAKKAAVIGWPVSHSLSPKLHGYWIEHYGLDASYEAVAIEPNALKGGVGKLIDAGYVGFNITIPHKEPIIELLDVIDDTARAIGAVNTVVIGHGKLLGMNSDAYGFMANIHSAAAELRSEKAVVLGAGGAARAVCYALQQAGFAQIIITNRTKEKAQLLADSLGDPIEVAAWEKRNALLADADLLVNTTSLGMKGKEPLTIDLAALPAHAVVNDIVYAPLETDLLRQARARKLQAVDGLGMLLHQAVPAFEAWFGQRPQVTAELKQLIVEGL
ncbi:MAG: shikimate dehydrogenase [Rickettsiales bacterium]|nr:shikimate dehydrogenase [Rickettsiales bacterium]